MEVCIRECMRLLQMVLDDTPYAVQRAWQQEVLRHPEWDAKKLKKQELKEEQARFKKVRSILFQDPDRDGVALRKQISLADSFAMVKTRPRSEPEPESDDPMEGSSSSDPKSPPNKRIRTGSPPMNDEPSGSVSVPNPKPKPQPKAKTRLQTTRKGKMQESSPLFGFFTVGDACVKCNCTILTTARGLCRPHRGLRMPIHRLYTVALLELIHEHSAVMAQCPLCEKGNAVMENCDKMACPNWGKRRKFQTEFMRLNGIISKLDPTEEEQQTYWNYLAKHPDAPPGSGSDDCPALVAIDEEFESML
jgi:hypothetical protein